MEGSLVLPVFLLFMMTVLLNLEVVRFQSDMQEAIHQTGNQYGFASYLIKYANQSPIPVENRVKEYLESQMHPYLCVSGGENGVKIQDLSAIQEKGSIEFTVEYQIKPFIDWLPIGKVVIKDRFFSHAFTGYTGFEEQEQGKRQETYVYVTKTGSKYHISYDCTYLRVQVRSVDYDNLSSLRNQAGEKYYACLRCRPPKKGIVYITEDGNRYHGQSDCSALKRVVYMIPLGEADGYSACSKCGG
ncbi:MAG: hypothetical protein K2H52_08235 [Lachnospiraceae bacterium]|nr:hypothetical protein [Lachnospiraceae bacterium]MDE6186158.1 hypothetical protein [Lachnospiraceae bacterium]MDE7285255.1 hypothetical protein [Lachnospiraceae bacterium]